MAALTNFLALEPELQARLQAQLQATHPEVFVLCSHDLDGVTEERQLTPAVHLVYQGYQVSESRADGTMARLEQTWLAVVTTRNARGLMSGDAARTQAGRLARQVCTALMGWRPASATRPLVLVQAPEAGFSGGFQYLPVAFKTEIVLGGA